MRILFVSSFVPRRCGIASFTKDLSLTLKKQGHHIQIAALENDITPVAYTSTVRFKIKQNSVSDYRKIATGINKSTVDVVHIQHEFGLFGGESGEFILELTRLLTKPLVVTFHTILSFPSDKQRLIIQELVRVSQKVVVMEEIAKDRLERVYGINMRDVEVIFHGVPDVGGIEKTEAKKRLHLDNTFVLLASNLISRNKGLEYVIEALPKIIPKIPHLVFLIVGETHPVIKSQEGESYRQELAQLVRKHKLKGHVRFKNKYVSLAMLRVLLAASDICLTPYLDAQQITSGSLSYAIGAGKACISTPFMYAKDMLSNGRGVLVPFRDSQSIAQKVLDLFTNPKKREAIEKRAYKLGREMRWERIGEKHSRLYKEMPLQKEKIARKVDRIIRSLPDISYLEYLTDNVGIFQHSHYIIPESRFGYSTDDNARALIVASALYKKAKTAKLLNLMKVYLSFLRLAQGPNGRFHTFLNFHRQWIDSDDVADPYGKAIWGLGFHLYACKKTPLTQSVHSMFIESMHQLEKIRDLRTAAYAILGLYYYIVAYEGKKESAFVAIEHMERLSDFLLSRYEEIHDGNWQWFENTVTYDNFRIPQALFAAYLITRQSRYREVAKVTLSFLTKWTFDDKRELFDLIGQDGWLRKGGPRALYDQQPLEAASAVETYLFASRALAKKEYIEKAQIAFAWFFGRNRNNTMMLDEHTKGVFDGLTPRGVNQNEGAESLVCYLISHLALYEAFTSHLG